MTTKTTKHMHEYYHHIDNGGLVVRLNMPPEDSHEIYNLEFYNSFHGHAGNSMKISNPSSSMLRALGEQLFVMAAMAEKGETGVSE